MSDNSSMGAEPKKSPMDTLINNLTGDLHQSYDGQYMVLGQPSQLGPKLLGQPNQPPGSQNHRWTSAGADIQPIQQPPIFKPQGSHQSQQNMFYNTLQNHGDFLPFNNLPHYQNSYLQQHEQQTQYSQQQYQPALLKDYGLFANHSEQMMSPPHNQHAGYVGHGLIDNLVGNWAPNQSGTYSPFGNLTGTEFSTMGTELGNVGSEFGNMGSEFGGHLGTDFSNPMSGGFAAEKEERPERASVFSDMPRQESLLAATRRPRAVAEVRPMRPSYSAVLTKAPVPDAATGSQASKAGSQQAAPVSKMKPGKGKKTEDVAKMNVGSTLKRQHSGGSEEVKLNSAHVCAASSKLHQNLAQWSGLDNSSNGNGVQNGGEDISENEEGRFNRKEGGRRSKRNKNKYHGLNEEEDEEGEGEYYEGDEEKRGAGDGAGKSSSAKRQNSSNVQWGVRETESSVNHRSTVEKKKIEGEKKKGTVEAAGKGTRKKEASVTSKKPTRATKKRDGHAHMIGVMIKQWHAECCRLGVLFAVWFFNLVWDIVAMSSGLMVYLFGVLWDLTRFWAVSIRLKLSSLLAKKWWTYTFPWRRKRPKLSKNISLPSTGDEAIRRLLSCKEKDPYSILGVAPDCTDDDIKKYYRRQAILVHPDKNQQAGAEEAFKTLAHAFDLIGESAARARYDQRVAESTQAEQAWAELNELLSKLSQKVEIATNTIRCTHCGGRHRRVLMERPSYAARYCAQCKIHHSAREGDIWAESWGLGLLWHYYACMETSVYDITEWAACQAVNLKHLKANSHSVQYRIVVGRQHPPSPSPSHHPHCPNGSSDPDIEDFLNTLYSSSGGCADHVGGHSSHLHHHGHTAHGRNKKKQGKKKK